MVREQSKPVASRAAVRLLVQPEDGIQTLLEGIANAKSSINIAIFRFDQADVERALAAAVTRGVAVCALIASMNRAGEANLRKLELRLLAAGVTVARTADDLIRYHGKYMIVDQRRLYLLAFNWTHADIERSRSFGVINTGGSAVREAVRLFEADSRRSPYQPDRDMLLVSPVNARQQLAAFIRHAKKELVIYDPRVSDRAMMKLLAERAKAGVKVRIIGRLVGAIPGVETCKLANLRLHTRSMIRDRKHAFIGSQSLRELELDARREVGMIFDSAKAVSRMLRTFEADWAAGQSGGTSDASRPTAKIARQVAKAVVKELPPLTPIVNGAVKEVPEADQIAKEITQVVRDAVQDAVRDAVEKFTGEAK